jgi:hypothetical protein
MAARTPGTDGPAGQRIARRQRFSALREGFSALRQGLALGERFPPPGQRLALRERIPALRQGLALRERLERLALRLWLPGLLDRLPEPFQRIAEPGQRIALAQRLPALRQRVSALGERLPPGQRLRSLAWVSHAAVWYSRFIRHDRRSRMFGPETARAGRLCRSGCSRSSGWACW